MSQYQTALTSRIIGIIFQNLSCQERLFYLSYRNSFSLPFVISVAAELIVP